MYEFLGKNNLLYDKQFGFRSNHSTSHALISLTDSIKNHLDNKKLVVFLLTLLKLLTRLIIKSYAINFPTMVLGVNLMNS